MPVRILIADGQPAVRRELRTLLEREGFGVVGEAGDGQEAVLLAQELRPDVAVVDVAMPLMSGLEALREIQRTCEGTRTIFLTTRAEDASVREALRAGIRGYVLKSRVSAELVRAIQEVTSDRAYLSPAVSEVFLRANRIGDDISPDLLTPRERQVLQLISEGMRTRKIAEHLVLSVKTVESHRTRLMAKLNIHQTAGLVRYAIRRGLIQP